jgi:hypothetical protein
MDYLLGETYRDQVSNMAEIRDATMLLEFCSGKPQHLLSHITVRDESCAADDVPP